MRMATVALAALGLTMFAPPAQATPGYGSDCILPSVEQCRLLPDADGPHMVERYCPGVGWINVFAPCTSRFGPYS
ncbi:hypothetical protein MU0083_002984 [[Mycobacterium] kokjensenii]|uniref:Uncharacterized protein n=1 Tax=[Mycobacterium] kokjensenii TaxID=3064287 RepID=A0ABN9N9H2_9MYCO|nr:hypothetical protein [Mycolicibacter sp. MU0083]CAJ1502643.1 hypothetical protein MU0083_002984 [Mycolicibacter sp. MU0083]